MASENTQAVWFNNFFQYGKSPKSENMLTLGFRLLNSEESKKTEKITLSSPIRATSRPLQNQEAEQLMQSIESNPELANFHIIEKELSSGNSAYKVLEIEIPNKRSVIKTLPREFQRGDYDKRLRFRFFPEQKFKSLDLVQRVLNNENQDYKPDFMSEDEFSNLPYVIIDIEKPLWRKEDEKINLKRREQLLKASAKDKFQERKERINSLLGRLEKKLTVNIDGVGEARLFDEALRADISFVTAYWSDDQRGKEKEIYLLDPREECQKDEHNDYKLKKFKTEKELVMALTAKFHEKNPVLSFGHNQVYDYTQLRFAADSYKYIFDPSVKDNKPRRDFVKSFLQRLREDLIYLDTMWLSQIFHPFLRQRSFGTSLKLESVARFNGIDFKKSLTHEQLREVEARRLIGQTEEIRKKALEDLLIYSSTDIEVTSQIKDKLPFAKLLTQLKRVFPFSTYSKLAFSPNSASEQNEYSYFRKRGCLPYTGFMSKERLDESIFASKLIKTWKKERLSSNNLFRARRGVYDNVTEFYLPLEDWMFRFATAISGKKLAEAYVALSDNPIQKMAFLQYVKAMLKSPNTDYFIARRYEQNAESSRKFSTTPESVNNISDEVIRALASSYRKIERGLFSLLPQINGEQRALLKPSKIDMQKNLFEPKQNNSINGLGPQLETLALFKKNDSVLRKNLVPSKKADLSKIVNGFSELLETASHAKVNINRAYSISQQYLAERAKARFFSRYGFSYDDFQSHLNEYHEALEVELTKNGAEFIDSKGDYIFVRSSNGEPFKDLNLAMKVRQLDSYEIS